MNQPRTIGPWLILSAIPLGAALASLFWLTTGRRLLTPKPAARVAAAQHAPPTAPCLTAPKK